MKGFLAQECSPDSIRLGWQENKPFNTKRWEAICDLGVLGANLKEEEFEEWYYPLTSTLESDQFGWKATLKEFLTVHVPTGLQVIKERLHEPISTMGSNLSLLFSHTCKGKAMGVVKLVPDNNGWEMLRQLLSLVQWMA